MMNNCDHILVCLDFTQMDDFLIGYSNFIVKKFAPKRVTFLHVMHRYQIPDEVRDAMPNMDKPLHEIVREDILEKMDSQLERLPNVQYDAVVREGYTTQHILEYTREEKVMLTLMGKKVGYKGMGNIGRKVTSLTPSSVMLVSETAQPRIEKIHVRMNFNRISEIALRTALRVAEKTGAAVACHNVYRFPLKYFGQPELFSPQKLEKIESQLHKHQGKEYQKFMKHHKLDPEKIPCEYTFDKEGDEAQILYNFAIRDSADLIVIGSRVKSGLTDVILDHTSEKLTSAEKNLPVLVVKDRKQTLGFLDSLFE